MRGKSIQAELIRLQIHPVNLDVAAEIGGNVVLKGSLLPGWKVPKSIDAEWFLTLLQGLPGRAGPEATMDAYDEAYSAAGAVKV